MRRALTIVASTAVLGCGRSWTIDLSDGSGSASASGEGPVDGCTPTGDVELCDGLDNDCDGLIDEDIEPVTCGFGGCQTIVYCEDGMMPPCVPREPGPELCNLHDDDCDGEVDEGFSWSSTARILLVEDNVVNQKVASRMLENLGCHVDVASDGRIALEMVESTPYDLVFMDIQMPQMDGLEATTELRRREGDAEPLPIIAMTAHAMADDRQRSLAVGMNDHISKPIGRLDLIRVLDEQGLWDEDVEQRRY